MIGHSPVFLMFFRDTGRPGAPLTPYEWQSASMTELVEALPHYEDAEEIWRIDPDVPPQNISEDAASAWWRTLEPRFDPATDLLPAFIEKHLPDIEALIGALVGALAETRADARALSSPRAMGRI